MFGFALKKWLFTYWDNMLPLLLANILFNFSIAAAVLGFNSAAALHPVVAILTAIAGGALVMLVLAGMAGQAGLISNGERPDRTLLRQAAGRAWRPSLFYGAINILLYLVLRVALKFYGSMPGLTGFILLCFVLWLMVFWLLTMQWFFPINIQADRRPLSILRKSFMLMFDNPGLTLLTGLMALAILVISGPTLTLFPGIGGLLLWHQTVLRLLMLKYEWLEKNPAAAGNKIPWKEILAAEREQLGTRNLRSLIFPWKDLK